MNTYVYILAMDWDITNIETWPHDPIEYERKWSSGDFQIRRKEPRFQREHIGNHLFTPELL